MDQLEEWRVRGRIATAVTNVKASLTQLVKDGQEFIDAMAEAETLGIYSKGDVLSEKPHFR